MWQAFRLRPTFGIPLDETRDSAIAKLERARSRSGEGELLLVHGEYGELHLPAAEHRLWSPHLSFYVHEHEGQVLLFGRFAPRVNVWTVVWIFYLVFLFLAFFGLTIAATQLWLEQAPSGLWISLVSVLLWGGLNAAARIGQFWSADQIHSLRERLERFLATAEVRLGPATKAGAGD